MSTATKKLRDYSVDARVLYVSVLAALLGSVSSVLAWVLLKLIDLATNLFYYHRFRFNEVEPAGHQLGWWSLLVPVAGGLMVGLIARFLSPKVRGHGMPEAIEVIVFQGGRVQPRVAILKPLATAISIGSGGPFGAEGPVIITGGAVGSVLGQLLPFTDAERTVLMVAGASAGMAAAFSCPLSAVLLAVEILLFEWRPRSLIPVAIACITAGAVRHLLLGPGPIFPMQPTIGPIHRFAMLGALAVGLLAALLSTGLSKALHFFETIFERLPIHWMWWPALGGVVIGLGGMIFPKSLGVGYDVIRELLNTSVTWQLLVGVLVVKSAIWVVALASETAGGVFAPLLMIGGALGLAVGHWLTPISPGAWAVVGMTSIISAALGAPLTAAMFAVELTNNGGLMIPVLLACVTSYAISVLLQPRSLVTEGLSRKGLHLFREYGVDPLETVMVREVMHTSVFALPIDATRQDAADWLTRMNERGSEAWSHWQRLFPLLDADGKLGGMLTRGQMITAGRSENLQGALLAAGSDKPIVVGPNDTLRSAAEKMGDLKLTSFPVVDAKGSLAGILTIEDLLAARSKARMRDSDRKRVLTLRWPFGGLGRQIRSERAIDDLVDRAYDSATKEQERLETVEEKIESGFD